MKEYTVKYFSGSPSWENVPYLEVSESPWFETPGISMRMQVLWNEYGLYVHQKAIEPNIRATFASHLSHVCDDSCMEFFFAPENGDFRYFNFELNPNGAMMLGFGTGRTDRIKLLPSDATSLFSIRTIHGEGEWETFYSIPVSFIRTFFPSFELSEGFSFRANAYKCGDKTDHVHYLTWNQMTSEKPDYHRYCDFGKMTLA